MWNYDKLPTKFCLFIDDFGVNYWSKANTEHLCNSAGTNFRHSLDREGSKYYSLTLKWNYKLGFVDTSILKYMPKTLKLLNHKEKVVLQCSPHKYAPIIYGQKGVQ